MNKVLVLGGTGLVGSAVCHVLQREGREFAFTSQKTRTSSLKNFLFRLDALPCSFLEKILKSYKPDIVVNCLHSAHPEGLLLTNLLIPQIIGNEYKIPLITISTDAVFRPGVKMHPVDETPQPTTPYELLKLASERIAPCLAIRTSMIGVPFWKDPLTDLIERYPTKKWGGRMWSGCTNLHLAEYIVHLTEAKRLPNRVVHFAPASVIPFDQALRQLFTAFNMPVELYPPKQKGSVGHILADSSHWACRLEDQITDLKAQHVAHL